MAMQSSILAIIAAGRKAFDKEGEAAVSRIAFIDAMVAAGFTYANTASYSEADLKAGKVSNERKVFRDTALLICAGTIKINKKRLSEADLRKFADEAVSNKVLLNGTAKGNLSSGTSWKGNATSYLNKVRLDLKAREDAGGKAPSVEKTDTDFQIDFLQKAYNRTFKENVKLPNGVDLAELQKLYRAVATKLGKTLATPKRKGK